MSESPSENKPSTSTPPKTPGWGLGLFGGLFSTSKKPKPVDSSREATGQVPTANGVPRSTIDLKTPSERESTSKSLFGNGPVDLLNTSTPSTANASTMLSPPAKAATTASMRAKSPWKSPTLRNGGVTLASRGVLKPAPTSSAKKVAPARASRRRKRHTPSVVLISHNKRTKKMINPAFAESALKKSRNLFEPSQQMEALQSYTSFKPGKRVLGSLQRGSRLPPENDSTTESQLIEEPSSKRQKKVSFNREDVVETLITTPTRDLVARKATPFKTAPATPEESKLVPKDNQLDTIGSPARKMDPKPEIKLTVQAPYTDFGAADELEHLGPPASGSTRAMFSFACEETRGQQPVLTDTHLPTFEPTKSGEQSVTTALTTAGESEMSEAQQTKKTKVVDEDSGPKTESSGWGNLFSKIPKGWQCLVCLSTLNKQEMVKCGACDAPRPGYEDKAQAASANSTATTSGSIGAGGFSFVGASGAPKAADKPTFSFGTGAAPAAASGASISSSGFSFTAKPPAATTDNSKPSDTKGGFKFGAAPAASPPVGGKSGFSFGGTSASSSASTSAAGGAGFSFGAPAPAPSGGKDEGSKGFSFGASSKPAATDSKSSGFQFGGATPAPSAAGTTTEAPSFSFGKTKDSKAPSSSLNPEAPAFSFGKTNDSAAPDKADKPKSFKFDLPGSQGSTGDAPKPFVFGANKTPPSKPGGEARVPATEPAPKRSRPVSNGDSSQPSSASKAKTSFSRPSESGSSQGLSFGTNDATKSLQSGSLTPGFSFGGVPGSDSGAPSKSAGFSFGGAPAPAPSAMTPGAGSNSLSTSNEQTRGSDKEDRSKRRRGRDEGSKPEDSMPPPPAGFSLGSLAPSPAPPSSAGLFGSIPAPKTGNGDASKPATASAPTNSTPGFSVASAPAPAAGSAGFSFGNAETKPAFGDTTNTGSSSSAAPPSYGGRSSAPASSPASVPMFGSQPAPAPATPAPSFGTPAPAPPAAGNTFGQPSAGSNPFGSAPAPAPPAPGFSFGSAPASGSAPTFGSTPAPAPATSFGATPAQPSAPAFGSAPTPSAAAPTFGSAPAPGAAAPTFGSTPAAPPAFGSTPAPAQAPAAPMFGSTPTAPQFGSAPAPPAFGSAPTPAFGSAAAPAPFGSTPAPAPFGAPAPATTFGSTPAPAPFGSTPAPAPFGAAPAPAPFPQFGGVPAPAPFGGGFGGNPAPPAPGSFNAAPPPQPGGFGGGFGAPNQMGNANMGMGQGAPQFSIGSAGTKTPGTRRKIRARRPVGSRPA